MVDEDRAAVRIEHDDRTAEQVQSRQAGAGMAAALQRLIALGIWNIARYLTPSNSRRKAATLVSERVMSSFRRSTRSRYFW